MDLVLIKNWVLLAAFRILRRWKSSLIVQAESKAMAILSVNNNSKELIIVTI